MGNFSIKTNSLKSSIGDMDYCSRRLGDLSNSILGISSSLKLSSEVNYLIKSQLKQAASSLDEKSRRITYLKNGLSSSIDTYENTERRILEKTGSLDYKKGTKDDKGDNIPFSSYYNIDKLNNLRGYPRSIIDVSGLVFGSITASSFIDYSDDNLRIHTDKIIGKMEIKGTSGGKFLEKKADEDSVVEYYDKDGNVIPENNASKFYSNKATLFQVSSGASMGVSALELGKDWKYGGAELTVGKAEAHSSISAGLYVIGYDKDGNKIRKFSPGVNAEVGASVTALSGKINGNIGSDMLGLTGEIKGEVGKAEMKANCKSQFFGEDGKLNVQAEVGASAEAILAGVEGKVGAKVLGGEIGAKGKLNVGIGAHANAGYKDGVIKADIGLSVGVGASVSLEVDVGGMVDTVCSASKSVVKGIGKFSGGLQKKAKKLLKW